MASRAENRVASFTFVQRVDTDGGTYWEVVHRGEIVQSQIPTEAEANQILAPLFDLDVNEVNFGRL
jgi:hypothetical protein